MTDSAPATGDIRSGQRYRLAALAVAANFGSKALSMTLMVLSVSLTIPYLGAERFGVWMTLASLSGMLAFMDLGVGNALTNRVAHAAANAQPQALQRTITGGLVALFLIACAAAMVLCLLSLAVPWGWLLKSSDASLVVEASTAAQVFAILFGVNLFAGGVQKVFLGLQRSFEAHLCAAGATVLTILALAGAAKVQAGVPLLLAVVAAGPALSAIPLLMLLLARRQLGGVQPLPALTTELPALLKTGSLFLALQVGTMVGWGADSLIISATLGSAQVAIYAVTLRLFQLVTVPLAVASQPLWGSYADAHARGDRLFIARTLKRSLLAAAIGACSVALLLIVWHEPIIARWTDGRVELPLAFLLTFAAWSVIEACATCAAMYMNGCAIIKPQVFAVLLFCALSIPGKLILANQYGLTGIVMSTIVSYLISVPMLYALFFRAEVTSPLRAAQP